VSLRHCLSSTMRDWRQMASVARTSFGDSSSNCSSERPLTSCVGGQVVGQVPAVLRLGQLFQQRALARCGGTMLLHVCRTGSNGPRCFEVGLRFNCTSAPPSALARGEAAAALIMLRLFGEVT